MSFFRFRRTAVVIAFTVLACLFLYTQSPYRQKHPFATFGFGEVRQIQYPFDESISDEPRVREDRLRTVKDEFLHSWRGYREYAWMMDEVLPVSGGNSTHFCGWAATLVDSLDTLHIMGLMDEWNEAVESVMALDFTTADPECSVNLFEMTIRHLGGFIAAYDVSQDKRLYAKAVEVGDMLFSGFNTSNGMQCSFFPIPPNPKFPCVPTSTMSLAGLGSLNLEFIRLSLMTGDPKYANAIGHVASEMARTQNESTIPGLWPRNIDASCAQGVCPFTGAMYTLGAGADSTYEYLVKSHLLIGSRNATYLEMWSKAVAQIRKFMLYQPMTPQNYDILFSAIISGTPPNLYLEPQVQHLACFLGGLFALSSRLASNHNASLDLSLAAKLTDGCVWAYNSTVSGVMPETFYPFVCEGSLMHCPWNGTRAKLETANDGGRARTSNPPGMASIRDARYLLRPEAIESVFVMYRLTGDIAWREKGWQMFLSVREVTRAPHGHSAIHNVLVKKPGFKDNMESFWLAETLKYFYLLFADPNLISLDEWVLNTEAHPFRLEDNIRGY